MTPASAVARVEPRLVRSAEVASQPWANGGGQTRELLALPLASTWQLRISVATVDASGPFSAYPGVERWFAVVEGAGVALTVGGTTHALKVGDAPLRFDGAAPAACALLGGPTRDLNLMLRGISGRMRRAAAGTRWQPTLAQCGLYSASAGRCRVRVDAGAGSPDVSDISAVEFAVPADALLWFATAPRALVFEPDRAESGAAWWLEAAACGPENEARS